MDPSIDREQKITMSRDHQLIARYINTIKLHRSLLERRLNSTGVYRSQHQLLMCIFNRPGISQKELADFHQVSSATVAVSLKKLEKGGYIERLVDAKDNRFNEVRITEKGREVAEESRKIFEEIDREVFCGLSEEDKENFDRYLCRIQENIKVMLQRTESEGQNS